MIRVLSYNIHKGFDSTNLGFALKGIKESIRQVQADFVFLQEVLGHHEVHGKRIEDWPTTSQFEYLADEVWPHFAYGKNAVYSAGHHGNAILSKFPIESWENVDLSPNRLERRGMLRAVVRIPEIEKPLHLVCLHLGLFESGRQAQLRKICGHLREVVPAGEPLIVAGDFNDWLEKLSKLLHKELGLEECFQLLNGRHARTFPIWMPALPLDRIYVRGLTISAARCLTEKPWTDLSDHAAVYAELKP